MTKLFNYRVLPIFLLVLVIGILAASFLHYAYVITLTVIAGLMVVVCFKSKRMRKYTSKAIMVTFALLIALCTTVISYAVADDASSATAVDVAVTGRVSGVSAYDELGNVNEKYFYIENVTLDGGEGSRKVSGYIKIYLADSNLKLGDVVTLRGDITPIKHNLSNQEYISYYRDRIYNTFTARSIVSITSGEPSFFDKIKLDVKKMYYSNSLGKVGGFMYAMMFGDSSGLDTVTRADAGSIGVAHLFAVSGLHVGMIALILVFFMDKMRLKAWLQALITIIVLTIYNFLCGFSSSVLRASIMIIVTHVARIVGFKNDSISTISFAGITILTFSPFALFDISFVMSFVAVLAIVFFNKPIKAKLVFLPNYLASILAMTISVNIGLLPIMIMCFGNLSLLFTLANMLIIPIVTFGYPIMFVSTLMGLVIPFLGVIIKPVSLLFCLVEKLISMISQLPFLSVDFNISIGILVGFIVIMVLLSRYIFIPKRLKHTVSSLLVLVFFAGVLLTSFTAANPKYEVRAMHVDFYTSQAYYRLSGGGENYIVVNGDLSSAAFERTLEASQSAGVDEYDALIIDSIDNEIERDVVDKYYTLLNAKSICIREYNFRLTAELMRGYSRSLISNQFALTYGVSGEILIEVDGSRLLFYNSYEPYATSHLSYDVVFPAIDSELVSMLNYDYIVAKNVPEISNDKKIGFTFKLNRGKILL